jgi:hypothetical protein
MESHNRLVFNKLDLCVRRPVFGKNQFLDKFNKKAVFAGDATLVWSQ